MSSPTSSDAVTIAAPGGEAADLSGPPDPMLMLQAGQFSLLLAAALYVARPIVLPMVLAILLKLLMQPGVRRLERWHVPRGAAAALMIAAVFSSLISLGTALSAPAQIWAEKLRGGMPRLRERLSFISGPVETLVGFLRSAETHMNFGAASVTTQAAPAPSWLSEMVISATASFASGFFETIVVLFFLLVSGDLFLRRLVEILPRFRDKRTAVTISQNIESDISAYLRTVTAMNAALGVLTSVLMWLVGLPNPALWGVLAFLLNYIPMVGPIMCMIALLLAGLLTIEPLWGALLPAAGFLALHVIEGQIVTPMLLARRFTLNPVVVIISLIFWYWMWGVPGAILAVPMLGMFKIICDGIRPWAPIGHLTSNTKISKK